MNLLSNIDGTIFINGVPVIVPSPNRFLSTASIPAPANPIDNTPFFVWTQYRDLLNREPDLGGFNGWNSVINSCGGDLTCINNQRIVTVRGFLESGEFRQSHPILLNNNPGTQAYNDEYVRQLYLCLLRRQPDAGGLAAWVGVLTSTGDYSLVVNGFINSTEYRRRFGPQ